jgi:hypothetical protein
MKSTRSLPYFILAITCAASMQTAYSASPAAEHPMTFLEEVNAYKTDTALFTADSSPLTIYGRFGSYTIATFKLSKCRPATLSNVVAKLKKYDSDVEIPRIWKIFYDSCTEIISATDKGDIYIPNTSGPVTITFDLEKNFGKTKWKPKGEDSIFVGKGSPSAIAPPVAAAPLPCGGGKVTRSDTVISFVINCTPNLSTVYYAYALHLDQIGSDKIGADIGIDPQIINHP